MQGWGVIVMGGRSRSVVTFVSRQATVKCYGSKLGNTPSTTPAASTHPPAAAGEECCPTQGRTLRSRVVSVYRPALPAPPAPALGGVVRCKGRDTAVSECRSCCRGSRGSSGIVGLLHPKRVIMLNIVLLLMAAPQMGDAAVSNNTLFNITGRFV